MLKMGGAITKFQIQFGENEAIFWYFSSLAYLQIHLIFTLSIV